MNRAAASTVGLALGTLSLASMSLGEPRAARAADSFVDTVGVNVHLHYTDTVYWNFPKLKAALKQLGVRHIRDGLVYDGRPEYYERHRQLAGAGIKTTFIVSGDLGKLATHVERVHSAVGALEGPRVDSREEHGEWKRSSQDSLMRNRHGRRIGLVRET